MAWKMPVSFTFLGGNKMNLSAIFGYDVAAVVDTAESSEAKPKTPVTKKQTISEDSVKTCSSVTQKKNNTDSAKLDLSDLETIKIINRTEEWYNKWLDDGQKLTKLSKYYTSDKSSHIDAKFYYWAKLLSVILDNAPASIFAEETQSIADSTPKDEKCESQNFSDETSSVQKTESTDDSFDSLNAIIADYKNSLSATDTSEVLETHTGEYVGKHSK